jgi:hypothetical protein
MFYRHCQVVSGGHCGEFIPAAVSTSTGRRVNPLRPIVIAVIPRHPDGLTPGVERDISIGEVGGVSIGNPNFYRAGLILEVAVGKGAGL